MEKKRVRIYKAQEGGQPTVDQLSYPGAGEQQQEELSQEAVMQMIYEDINTGMPVEGIMNKLVNAVGLDVTTAQQYIDAVNSVIAQEQEAAEQEMEEEEAPKEELLADEEMSEEEEEPMTPINNYADLAMEDDPEVEALYNEEFSMGGFTKRKDYVNNVLKNVKKQYGGNPEEEQVSDDSDPMGDGLRTNNLNSFIGAIKREGNMTIAKEQAKEAFDNAFNQHNEMLSQFIPEDYNLEEAQFGGDRRMMRRMRRLLRNMPQVGYPGQMIDNVEVQRTGLFGRPKEYTVNFNDSPLKALANNPMFAGDYEYGFPMQEIKTPAKVVSEDVINEEAIINQNTGGNSNSGCITVNGVTSCFPKRAFGGDVSGVDYMPGNPLQQFISGGNDITQNDIDDVYSKDVTDPYMPEAQRGGNWRNYFENYFPANIMPTHYTQYRGTYDSAGNLVMPEMSKNTMIRNVHVDRQNIFGRPKEYTVNFTNPEMDPRKQNLITVPSGTAPTTTPATGVTPTVPTYPQAQDIDMTGVGMRGRMAINKGERQVARNERRLGRHPEYMDPIYTPDQIATRNIFRSGLQSNAPKAPKGPIFPGITDKLRKQFQQYAGNQSGLPDYNNTPFAYGGNLNKFIPQAQSGAQSPIVYTNNPALAGISSASMVNAAAPANAVNMAGLSGGTNLSWNAPGMANQANAQGVVTGPPVNAGFTGQQPIQSQMQIAPSQTGSHQIAKTYAPPAGDYSMKFKDKTNIDGEAAVNVFNAGVSGITGLINRKDDRMNQMRMYDNLTADNLYASDPSLDRGDTDTNTGLYRPDEMGQTWNSRSKQYGGAMDDYTEGDEVFMTEDELDNFLANGGEVEYI